MLLTSKVQIINKHCNSCHIIMIVIILEIDPRKNIKDGPIPLITDIRYSDIWYRYKTDRYPMADNIWKC